jgi:metal-responsive CopG/Arc/MetJ family transcriptional regulator
MGVILLSYHSMKKKNRRRPRGKVAVSVSPDLLDAIEAMRARSGESRSAVFERALAAYVASVEGGAQSRRYVEGYLAVPESPSDVDVSLAAAMPALSTGGWDAEG